MADEYDDRRPDAPGTDSTDGLDPVLREAMRAELASAVAGYEEDWATFERLVWARLDDTTEDPLPAAPTWSAVVAALRDDHAAALAEFEARHTEFEDGFNLRWVEGHDGAAETVGNVLREEVEVALAAKDGVWSAFKHQVMAAIDRADASAQAVEPMTEQAVRAFREDVIAELDALAPRFDRDFREGVEQRIFRSARQPSWWTSVRRSWGEGLRSSFGFAPSLGFAAAAAAILVMVIGPQLGGEAPAGAVSIQAVRFGGTVTVMPDDGIAIVWVTDDAS